ncbi:LysM peptidoglycan-binding domain-containing protein [Nocardioides xinjiangensis]|uniref:LysM peptidoglycan-binding domain-containing protein n=1 Tax=Nocardioides xinjiangensis TaxID=2817376 RepID=UPI001B317567|nr:LysM peptidoglycan-binding domain-containing protein [Nocardioides sp. SYSU D00514]
MSRDPAPLWRPLAVWLAATVVAATAAAAAPRAWERAGSAPASDRLTDLVVAGCASALAVALGWLWLLTTTTVLDVLGGGVPTATGATRRLVLLACGVAAAASTTVPAHAVDGEGAELLVGLGIPDRAVAQVQPQRDRPAGAPEAPATPGTHVVRPGDSLWSIARDHPGSGDVHTRWRAIWAANREVVGRDPDLIHPGQVLRLPGTRRTVGAPTDTDSNHTNTDRDMHMDEQPDPPTRDDTGDHTDEDGKR